MVDVKIGCMVQNGGCKGLLEFVVYVFGGINFEVVDFIGCDLVFVDFQYFFDDVWMCGVEIIEVDEIVVQ